MSPLQVFSQKKRDHESLVMISLYDAPTARIACDAGVDALLVGDSMGNVVLGYDSTLPVTMEEMVGHTASVVRGVKSSTRPGVPIVADLPFGSYGSVEQAIHNSVRLLQVGAHAVKLEGDFPVTVRSLKAQGIPVMGHLGFTPQSQMVLEHIVQGREADAEPALVQAAHSLDDAGVFAMVLEAVVTEVAGTITQSIKAPTVGIGAGAGCSGQVLVFQDLVGLSPHKFRFVKRYAETGALWQRATAEFVSEVRAGAFPDESHGWKREPQSPVSR